MMLKKRIVNMINGDKQTKENFALLSVNSARTIIKAYIKNKKVIDEIVDCIESDTISAFELKDVLNQVFNAEGIKESMREKVKATQEMKDIAYDLRLMPEFKNEEEETEDEKKKRIGTPIDDVQSILKELGCEKSIEKLKEHMIKDEQFWELTEDEFKDMLEVTVFGTRKKLMKKIEILKKEHAEQMDILYKEGKKLNTDGIKLLL
jgi:hypothetical protein